MRPQPILLLIILVGISAGCARVRLAIYDEKTRREYTENAKESYLNSPAGKSYSLKKSMVESAQVFLGAPYRYGGLEAKKGFDCSGLVYTVAKKNQLELPRSSSLMAKAAPHQAWKNASPGDLVFFGARGRIDHVGIVEKNGSGQLVVIHSTSQRGVISENVLDSPYWKKRILFSVDISAFQNKESRKALP
jgi:cell wall-associated NlpC family hydrolase